MNDLTSRIHKVDWSLVEENLHANGYALVPNLLTPKECEGLKELYGNPSGYRKTVVMERYRFGLGEYKYFDYPLPNMIQTLRETIYPYLVPMANLWMKVLKMEKTFPNAHQELLGGCLEQNQLKPTPLILKYGEGGFNTLHQDLYGDVYFPLQLVFFLSEPGQDYEGGEFVLTQQTPRAQSKAMVLRPKKRDMLVFTTNFRPIQGQKGYYRATMKHGVSEVSHGERYTLGIIFHDAIS